jgi:hypothetical protein
MPDQHPSYQLLLHTAQTATAVAQLQAKLLLLLLLPLRTQQWKELPTGKLL